MNTCSGHDPACAYVVCVSVSMNAFGWVCNVSKNVHTLTD